MATNNPPFYNLHHNSRQFMFSLVALIWIFNIRWWSFYYYLTIIFEFIQPTLVDWKILIVTDKIDIAEISPTQANISLIFFYFPPWIWELSQYPDHNTQINALISMSLRHSKVTFSVCLWLFLSKCDYKKQSVLAVEILFRYSSQR